MCQDYMKSTLGSAGSTWERRTTRRRISKLSRLCLWIHLQRTCPRHSSMRLLCACSQRRYEPPDQPSDRKTKPHSSPGLQEQLVTNPMFHFCTPCKPHVVSSLPRLALALLYRTRHSCSGTNSLLGRNIFAHHVPEDYVVGFHEPLPAGDSCSHQGRSKQQDASLLKPRGHSRLPHVNSSDRAFTFSQTKMRRDRTGDDLCLSACPPCRNSVF